MQLAKATTLHIVFDYHWLSLDSRVPFQRIVKGKETLTGFPVADYYSRFYQRADWTVFAPPESKKRPRRGDSASSTAWPTTDMRSLELPVVASAVQTQSRRRRAAGRLAH